MTSHYITTVSLDYDAAIYEREQINISWSLEQSIEFAEKIYHEAKSEGLDNDKIKINIFHDETQAIVISSFNYGERLQLEGVLDKTDDYLYGYSSHTANAFVPKNSDPGNYHAGYRQIVFREFVSGRG